MIQLSKMKLFQRIFRRRALWWTGCSSNACWTKTPGWRRFVPRPGHPVAVWSVCCLVVGGGFSRWFSCFSGCFSYLVVVVVVVVVVVMMMMMMMMMMMIWRRSQTIERPFLGLQRVSCPHLQEQGGGRGSSLSGGSNRRRIRFLDGHLKGWKQKIVLGLWDNQIWANYFFSIKTCSTIFRNNSTLESSETKNSISPLKNRRRILMLDLQSILERMGSPVQLTFQYISKKKRREPSLPPKNLDLVSWGTFFFSSNLCSTHIQTSPVPSHFFELPKISLKPTSSSVSQKSSIKIFEIWKSLAKHQPFSPAICSPNRRRSLRGGGAASGLGGPEVGGDRRRPNRFWMKKKGRCLYWKSHSSVGELMIPFHTSTSYFIIFFKPIFFFFNMFTAALLIVITLVL